MWWWCVSVWWCACGSGEEGEGDKGEEGGGEGKGQVGGMESGWGGVGGERVGKRESREGEGEKRGVCFF